MCKSINKFSTVTSLFSLLLKTMDSDVLGDEEVEMQSCGEGKRWWMEGRGFLDLDGDYQHNKQETQWLTKHICNYIYLFPPFGYLQTFISAYFQKHEISCFFIFSFLKVRTGQCFFHAKVCIMRTKANQVILSDLCCFGPFSSQTIQDTWLLVLFLSWFSLPGPGTTPEDLHVCGFAVFRLLQNGTTLAALWRIQFCWWLLMPGMQPGKIVDAKSYACWVNRVTLINWGYFIIKVHQGDTVTPSPSLPWKPSTGNRDFILITGHDTTNTNTLHFQWDKSQFPLKCSSPKQGTMQVDSLVNVFVI